MGIIGWIIVIYILYVVANIVYDLYIKKGDETIVEEEVIPISMDFEAPADAGAIIVLEREEEERREAEIKKAERLKLEEAEKLRKECEQIEEDRKLKESLSAIQEQKKIEDAVLLAEQQQATEIATSSSETEYLSNVTMHGGYNIESMKDIVRSCQDNSANNPMFGFKMLK